MGTNGLINIFTILGIYSSLSMININVKFIFQTAGIVKEEKPKSPGGIFFERIKKLMII